MSIKLKSTYLKELKRILHANVPHAEVWAYGSRVRGDCHEGSDLDLVVHHPKNSNAHLSALANLKEAFINSTIPILIDVLGWSSLPQSMQDEISKAYVVIQP